MMLDKEFVRGVALVVDGDARSREVLVQMVRNLGFRQVRQAQRVSDARDMLELRRFALVVCDPDTSHSGEPGHTLLDALQGQALLPYATVFVMVMAEATWAKVTEAGEAALDSCLVKPFTGRLLTERIQQARQRKQELQAVFDAIEAGDLVHATRLCSERFQRRAPYWLYSARLGAELLLRQGRHAEALRQFQQIQAVRPQLWARLGVARAQQAGGDVGAARRTLVELLAEQPMEADAHDVLGHLQLDQGQIDEALNSWAAAARLTPDCVLRQQQHGLLAACAGEAGTARAALQRAWTLGARSRLFDPQVLLLLALLRLDAGEDAAEPIAALRKAAEAALASQAPLRGPNQDPSHTPTQNKPQTQAVRLPRLLALAEAVQAAASGDLAQAQARADAALGDPAGPELDAEAAAHAIAVWSRLAARGAALSAVETRVRPLAQRFCVSRAAADLLGRAAQPCPEAQGWIREAQAEVMRLAEDAMNHALQGEPTTAVRNLIERGRRSGNAKLIELAGLVTQRYRDRISDLSAVQQQVSAISQQFVAGPALPLQRRSVRAAGGVALRSRPARAVRV